MRAGEGDQCQADPREQARPDDRDENDRTRSSRAAAPQRHAREADQQQREQDHACAHRQADQRTAGEVHEDPASGGGPRSPVRQCFRERQSLVAHVLQRRRIERRHVVARRMVARLIADRREVERQPAALGEAVDVGVIGHQPVDVRRKRIRDRMRDRRSVNIDRRRIRLARLEHVHRAANAACFEVDQAADVGAERVGEERSGAD
jgi:hypothetical protein